jgi:hypothetical protein
VRLRGGGGGSNGERALENADGAVRLCASSGQVSGAGGL